ncbi:MAG: ABC transporter permease subunit [Treponema sp.]|nr:ABC transporter permease subunit [Treponema sp.]
MIPKGFLRVNPLPWALALPPLGAVFFFFIMPYASALLTALPASGGAADTALPERGWIIAVAAFTVRQAALSTLLALALGLPGAWLLGTGRFRSRGLIRAVTSVPFAMPPILVVLGFVLFFGNAGWANRLLARPLAILGEVFGLNLGPLRILYRPGAVILAHAFYNFPLVIRLAGDGIAQSRRAYDAPAAALGASPFKAALTVHFPLVLPSVLAAALLVFLYSFTSFAVVLVLGGGPRATTLAVEIYRYARVSLDYQSAGFLALIETCIAALAFGAYLFFARKSGSINAAGTGDLGRRVLDERKGSAAGKIFAAVYGLALIFLVMGPLLSAPAESLLVRASRSAAPEISLRWWRSLGEEALPCLGRSLLLAALSATLATVLAALAASAARIDRTGASSPGVLGGLIRVAATSPLASSGIVLGLGWLSLYGGNRARSLPALVILHAVTAFPFAFNSIAEGLRSIPQSAAKAASVLGANPPAQVLTVELPLTLGRFRSAWAFSAAISLGELNAILILGMERWETLPLLIYRAAGAYRYGIACAGGTVLMLCCAGAFLLSELGRR